MSAKHNIEIHKDSGLYGIEFTIDKTIPDFIKASIRVDLAFAHQFEYENVLEGPLNSAWKHVLNEHFLDPVDNSTGDVPPESNQNSEESFKRAIELFLQHSAHEKKIRDRQLIYYQPGGDYQFRKDLATSAIDQSSF